MKAAKTKAAEPASGSSSSFFKKKGGDASLQQETPFFGKNNTQDSIQAKLNVGQPNDKYEVEADAMADKVVQRMAEPGSTAAKPALQPSITPFVQTKCDNWDNEEKLQKKEEENEKEPPKDVMRKPAFGEEPPPVPEKEEAVQLKCADCEKEETVQKKGEAGTASPKVESGINSSKGGGAPLPDTVRGGMENAMGADLSQVRVHTDSNAANMSQQLRAQAFTNGNDIYFNSGKYNTSSTAGKHLLAHEVTHTLQQSGKGATGMQRKPGDVPGIQRLPFLVGLGVRYLAGKAIAWGWEQLFEEESAQQDMVLTGHFIVRALKALTIELQGMGVFAPPAMTKFYIKLFALIAEWCRMNPTDPEAIAFQSAFADELANGLQINIRYGKLASKKGVRIHYDYRTGLFSMAVQFMEMNHPAFNMDGRPDNTYLAVGFDPVTNIMFGGITVLPRGLDLTAADKAAMDLVMNEEIIIKLVFGTDYPIEKFTKVVYQNAIAGGMLQVNVGGYFDIGNGQMLIGGFALFDEAFSWTGNLKIKINGLEEKEMLLDRDTHAKISGLLPDIQLNKTWNINNITAAIHASYINGLLDIRGTASYTPTDPASRVKKAAVTILVTTKEQAWADVRQQLPGGPEAHPLFMPAVSETGEELTVTGWGSMELSIIKNEDGSDLVTGKAGLVLDPDAHITVSGSITVEQVYELMQPMGTDWEPVMPEMEFGPVWVGGIPGIPAGIGLNFTGKGGLFYKYMLGPLTLHDITISGIYSTNPTINKELAVSARLNLSAALNGKAEVSGKAAARVGTAVKYLGLDLASLELTVAGEAALNTYMDIESTLGVREVAGGGGVKTPRAFLKGAIQLAGELLLGLSGTVKFNVLYGSVADKTISKMWPVANAGLTVDFDYNIGDKLSKEKLAEIVKFRKSAFDRSKFVQGVLKEKTPEAGKGKDKGGFLDENGKKIAEGSDKPIPIPEKTIEPTTIKDDFKMGNEWHYLQITVGDPKDPISLKMASGTPIELADKIRAERDRTILMQKSTTDSARLLELAQKLKDLKDLQDSATAVIHAAQRGGFDPNTSTSYDIPGLRALGDQIGIFGRRYGVSDLGTSSPGPGNTQPNRDLGDGSYNNPIPIRWIKRGYHTPITLRPRVERWRGALPPPPAVEVTANVSDRTKLELPPTQRRSFPTLEPGLIEDETRAGQTVRVVYIGVAAHNQAQNIKRANRRLQRERSSGTRSMSNKIRTLLNNYHYDWNETDADHALDLGWGGQDRLDNLWPIYRHMNQREANAIYDQPVEYISNGNVNISTPRELIGSWFTISSIGDLP